MPATVDELYKFYKKTVSFVTDEETVSGKVLAVARDGVAVRVKGNVRIIKVENILSHEEVVRPRRTRVVRRVVRRIGDDSSVKQHLADRHALFVDLCNAISEEDAHALHNKINHANLGHYHRDPTEAMEELDDTAEDDID